jgi:hypothetical protein
VRFSVGHQEMTMRHLTFACLLSMSVLGVAGCATEAEDVDGSGAAASGAPGPANDRARAEKEAQRDQAFVDATRPEILLARYQAVPDAETPSHFRPTSESKTCLAGYNSVELFSWNPYRAVTVDTLEAARAYQAAFSTLGYRFDLRIIQRQTGATYDLKFVALKDTPLCSDTKVSEGARVVLHCTNVDATGPNPAYCGAPARGSAAAIPE